MSKSNKKPSTREQARRERQSVLTQLQTEHRRNPTAETAELIHKVKTGKWRGL